MRTQLRIVAGTLKGRKVVCDVKPDMRPTPQMVREALFSILGNAVPGRTFVDVFAGTGINGLEALSRGAAHALFLERDFRLAQSIQEHAREFCLAERTTVLRSDVYRWAGYWKPGTEPVNVFLSPPFPDLRQRSEDFARLVETIQQAMPNHSVLALQSEQDVIIDQLPGGEAWDIRQYGRNVLMIWVKDDTGSTTAT